MVSKCELLIDNVELQKQLSINSIESSKQYSIKSCAEQHEKIYLDKGDGNL